MTCKKLAESQPGHVKRGADYSTGVFRDDTDISLPECNTTVLVLLYCWPNAVTLH